MRGYSDKAWPYVPIHEGEAHPSCPLALKFLFFLTGKTIIMRTTPFIFLSIVLRRSFTLDLRHHSHLCSSIFVATFSLTKEIFCKEIFCKKIEDFYPSSLSKFLSGKSKSPLSLADVFPLGFGVGLLLFGSPLSMIGGSSFRLSEFLCPNLVMFLEALRVNFIYPNL